MILYHGYVVTALNRAYWPEATFIDEDVSVFGPSEEGEKIGTAAAGEQLLLMPLPEVSKRPLISRNRNGGRKKTGHAGISGQGPAGESCGSCAAYRRVQRGGGTHTKCELTRARWSKGPGSDIRKSDAACGRWEASASS